MLMLLTLHIGLAVLSLLSMSGAVIGKARQVTYHDKLVQVSGASFIAMLGAGLLLAIQRHSSITTLCLEGVVFLAVLASLYAVYRRTAPSSN